MPSRHLPSTREVQTAPAKIPISVAAKSRSNMAMQTTGKGQLVGVVTKVSATYCVVSTILDPNVNVSAYEVRTRESGFISNSASLSKDGFCRLSGLDRTTSIAAGGIVCTTGVGGVYPRDLIVGTVKEVKNEDSDISSYAIVEPSADIDNLEDALIITEFDGQGASQNVSE